MILAGRSRGLVASLAATGATPKLAPKVELLICPGISASLKPSRQKTQFCSPMAVGLTLYDVLGIPIDATTDHGSSLFVPSSCATLLTWSFCSEEGVQDQSARNTPGQARANSDQSGAKSGRGQVQKRRNIVELRACPVLLNSY